jgi:sirohydrochlorin ferrochelatase
MIERVLGPQGAPGPALIVVAHGSRDPRAAATVDALAARVRTIRPGVDVMAAYLEHVRPRLHEVLATAYERGHRAAVVAPLLLTAAYHSRIDLPRQLASGGPAVMPDPGFRLGLGDEAYITPPERAVGSVETAAPVRLIVRQASVLGPHAALLNALERRIREAGIALRDPRWGLVVAAAGSTDPEAQASVTIAAAELCRRGWRAAVPGFAASANPSVPEAVASLRKSGISRVAIASYLLAPGQFSNALSSAGADVVTAPLGDAPEVAGLLLRRYDATARALAVGRCCRDQRVPLGRQ